MTSGGYFDELYAEHPDPWGLATRRYEQRKLAILLASLPRPRYRSAFEPGCAIGVTSLALSARCDRLLAVDGAAAAVRQARARTAGHEVEVRQALMPADWPSGPFDLVVVSELLYYLDEPTRAEVADRLVDSVAPGADVVLVHWRHPFAEAPATGDFVQAELSRRLAAVGGQVVVDHVEADFLLRVVRMTP